MLKFQLRFENSLVSGGALGGNHIFPTQDETLRWEMAKFAQRVWGFQVTGVAEPDPVLGQQGLNQKVQSPWTQAVHLTSPACLI